MGRVAKYCGHPECTGIHGSSRPAETWCPAFRERRRQYELETYSREESKVNKHRQSLTPGTYSYKAMHGQLEGELGRKYRLARRIEARRHYRTAKGMLRAERSHLKQKLARYEETCPEIARIVREKLADERTA